MAASAALSKSNLHSQSFWNVFNLLDTRTNVVDPVDGTGKRKLVHSHDPDIGRGFNGYPLIIVYPFKIKIPAIGEGTRTADDKNAEVTGETIVEVRGQDTFGRKSTASNPEGRGIADFDNLCDDVLETLQSVTNRNTLRSYNMGKVGVEEGRMDFSEVEGEAVYLREFRVSFNTKLIAVSS